jgi:hypothetical protein
MPGANTSVRADDFGKFLPCFIDILSIFFLVIDVRMASPPVSPPRNALQGASRTTGGVLRGRAYGNVFNRADGDEEIHVRPRKGKVLVYQSPRDPITHKPDMSITSDVTPRLKPILKTLARGYSPVRSK